MLCTRSEDPEALASKYLLPSTQREVSQGSLVLLLLLLLLRAQLLAEPN